MLRYTYDGWINYFKTHLREKNPFIVNGYEISSYSKQDREMEQEQLQQEFNNFTPPDESYLHTSNVSMY